MVTKIKQENYSLTTQFDSNKEILQDLREKFDQMKESKDREIFGLSQENENLKKMLMSNTNNTRTHYTSTILKDSQYHFKDNKEMEKYEQQPTGPVIKRVKFLDKKNEKIDMKINKQREQIATEQEHHNSFISTLQLSEMNLKTADKDKDKLPEDSTKNHNFIQGTWKKSNIKTLIEAEIATKDQKQLETRLKQMLKAKEAVETKIKAIPTQNSSLLVISLFLFFRKKES